MAQTPNIFSGQLNVVVFPANNGDGTFSLQGTFSDPKGLYSASGVADTMYFWKGNNLYPIVSVDNISGSTLSLTVDDLYSSGFISTGVGFVIGSAANGLPGVPTTGDSNPSLATPPDYNAILNYIITQIGNGSNDVMDFDTTDTGLGIEVNVNGAVADTFPWHRKVSEAYYVSSKDGNNATGYRGYPLRPFADLDYVLPGKSKEPRYVKAYQGYYPVVSSINTSSFNKFDIEGTVELLPGSERRIIEALGGAGQVNYFKADSVISSGNDRAFLSEYGNDLIVDIDYGRFTMPPSGFADVFEVGGDLRVKAGGIDFNSAYLFISIFNDTLRKDIEFDIENLTRLSGGAPPSIGPGGVQAFGFYARDFTNSNLDSLTFFNADIGTVNYDSVEQSFHHHFVRLGRRASNYPIINSRINFNIGNFSSLGLTPNTLGTNYSYHTAKISGNYTLTGTIPLDRTILDSTDFNFKVGNMYHGVNSLVHFIGYNADNSTVTVDMENGQFQGGPIVTRSNSTLPLILEKNSWVHVICDDCTLKDSSLVADIATFAGGDNIDTTSGIKFSGTYRVMSPNLPAIFSEVDIHLDGRFYNDGVTEIIQSSQPITVYANCDWNPDNAPVGANVTVITPCDGFISAVGAPSGTVPTSNGSGGITWSTPSSPPSSSGDVYTPGLIIVAGATVAMQSPQNKEVMLVAAFGGNTTTRIPFNMANLNGGESFYIKTTVAPGSTGTIILDPADGNTIGGNIQYNDATLKDEVALPVGNHYIEVARVGGGWFILAGQLNDISGGGGSATNLTIGSCTGVTDGDVITYAENANGDVEAFVNGNFCSLVWEKKRPNPFIIENVSGSQPTHTPEPNQVVYIGAAGSGGLTYNFDLSNLDNTDKFYVKVMNAAGGNTVTFNCVSGNVLYYDTIQQSSFTVTDQYWGATFVKSGPYTMVLAP